MTGVYQLSHLSLSKKVNPIKLFFKGRMCAISPFWYFQNQWSDYNLSLFIATIFYDSFYVMLIGYNIRKGDISSEFSCFFHL